MAETQAALCSCQYHVGLSSVGGLRDSLESLNYTTPPEIITEVENHLFVEENYNPGSDIWSFSLSRIWSSQLQTPGDGCLASSRAGRPTKTHLA